MKNPKFHGKRMGEWAEVCFTAAALYRGFSVAKPYGECEPYDVILSRGRTFYRIQVRSTTNFDGMCYYVATTRGKERRQKYGSDEIDFMAALVVPCNAWYIFPVSYVADRCSIKLAPHRTSRAQSEQFLEAWHLLRV